MVHLRKIPLHAFTWEALSFMTSTVGYPVRLHPETMACSNFEEAKVFVKWMFQRSCQRKLISQWEAKSSLRNSTILGCLHVVFTVRSEDIMRRFVPREVESRRKVRKLLKILLVRVQEILRRRLKRKQMKSVRL